MSDGTGLPVHAQAPGGTDQAAAAMSDDLVKLDFERIYAVYLDNLQQKASLFKLLISFVITPYLVAVAFLSAKALEFSAIDDLRNLPTFLDFVIVVAGAGLLLPLFQYIEYDDNVMRTARSINHFRGLYVQRMSTSSTWRPNLPTNQRYPRERQLKASGTILVLTFMLVAVVYVAKGLAGLADANPLHAGVIAMGAAAFSGLTAWYLLTGHNKEYEKRSDPKAAPSRISVWLRRAEPHEANGGPPEREGGSWIVAPTVGRAWAEYLDHVCRHGRPMPDDRGQIVEAPALAITIEGFDDDDPIVREHGDAEIKDLYVRKMFSSDVLPELGTTYGDRLFDYGGRDQIAGAIAKLETDWWTKSATLTLLDPLERWPERRMPCLAVIDLKVRDSRLALFAFFRSQNVLNAYGNMYGLRAVQTHCARRLSLGEGALTLFVASPHVYEQDLPSAERIAGACHGTPAR